MGNTNHKHGMEAVGMIVASSSVIDKSNVLANLAEDLVGFVRQSVRDGDSLDDVERGAFRRLLAMGHASVDLFLQAQGNGDLGETVTTEQGSVLYRSKTVMPRPVRTIFGEHCFEAFVYSRGEKEKIELRPIDARLNLPDGKASYLLQEFSQMFCVEKAFGVGARQFETVFQQKLSVDVLEGINRDMGAQADRFFESLKKPAVAKEGELLVATADGKGVPLVQEDADKIPVFDEKERPGNRRMATLGCVYTVDRHVRSPEQIVAALFHEKMDTPPAVRPKPRCKRYRGFFTSTEPGEEPIPSAYRTWGWLTHEVTSRHRDGQPVIRLMDGQPSLWNAADACLDDFIEDLRQKGEAKLLIDILDIIHVSAYVWRAAKVFHTHKEHQEAFAHKRLLRILRGEVSGVVKGLRRMATEHEFHGAQLKEISTVCNYFENNAHRMRYDEFLKAGYPIASGVIEGACRHIIKDRMEQGGMRWRLLGAEAMLNVRAVNASSEWEKFGRWRQTEQAKQVHPHRSLVAEYQGFAA
jgi:hypothetical protein